jgi:hypothetical protein
MLVPILTVSAACLAACVAVVMSLRAEAQNRWPQVTGRIMRSGIQVGRSFFPDIQYVLVFQGTTFRCSKVRSFLVEFGWPGPARRISNRYPAGSSVVVYVDLTDPNNSVLEPGGDPAFLPIVLTVFAAIAAIVILKA